MKIHSNANEKFLRQTDLNMCQSLPPINEDLADRDCLFKMIWEREVKYKARYKPLHYLNGY